MESSVGKAPGYSSVPAKMMKIPDLFVAWAALPPRFNPYYKKVKSEVDEWFKLNSNLDNQESQRYVDADFPYFCALWVPDADEEGLRLACDWMYWVFVFDDRIDTGELKYKTELANYEVQGIMSLTGPNPTPYSRDTRVDRYLFDLIWKRVQEHSKGLQERFITSHWDYGNQILEQTDPDSMKLFNSLDGYIEHHNKTCGIYAMAPLTECCNQLDLPDFIFESQSIQKLVDLAAEIVLLTNDICSHVREMSFGDEHNSAAFLQGQGMNQEAAYDMIGKEISQRYQDWHVALANLPQWGEDIDKRVQLYVRGLRELVVANLWWSFETPRYFGEAKEIARKQRLVPVTFEK